MQRTKKEVFAKINKCFIENFFKEREVLMSCSTAMSLRHTTIILNLKLIYQVIIAILV
jgi:hypothetical protein